MAKRNPKLPAGVKLLRTLGGHKGWIGRIAWSPDGRMLASPSRDKTIRLWDAETGECRLELEGHQRVVVSTAFDPSGCTLASGSGDGTIKLREPTSARLLQTLEGHKGIVRGVAFVSEGRTPRTRGSAPPWHVNCTISKQRKGG